MAEPSSIEVGKNVLVQCSEYQGLGAVTASEGGVVRLQLAKPAGSDSLEVGHRARLKTWDDQGVYYFTGEVAGFEGGNRLELSISGEPVAIQRRGSLRVVTKLGLAFKVTESAHAGLQSGKVYDAETQNIGAGGLSFDTIVPLKAMDQLAVELHLSGEDVSVEGAVVTSEKVVRNGRHVNAVGIEFFELADEVRQKLVDYLMSVQGMDE